jgi:serine/threonine-protein kinase
MEQPKTLGRYQLSRVLGRGAMGVVYEGMDPKLNRQVAVKTILKSRLDDLVQSEEYSIRFMREAQAVARLNHPNIVTVFDFGNELDVSYLVMEFIRGRELKSLLEEKRLLSIDEAAKIVGELLAALDYAHEHGVIHRDVKPANVMLDESGRVKLTDFGVARLFDAGSLEGTRPGTMVGTLGYMAPEQIKGLSVAPQADIFAAGVLLYQCLTLKKPFVGVSEWDICRQILSDAPPPLSQYRSGIPEALESVVMRAMAKEPNERFPSARSMNEALRTSISGLVFDEDATRLLYDPMATKERTSARGSSFTTNVSRAASFEPERDFWNSIKDSNDVAELEEFLVQFPDGIFANLARIRIGKSSGIRDTGIKAAGLQNLEQTRLMQEEGPPPPNLVAQEQTKEGQTAVLTQDLVEVLDPSLRRIVSTGEAQLMAQEPAKPKKSRKALVLAGAAAALTAVGAIGYIGSTPRLPTPTPPAPMVSPVSNVAPPAQAPEVAQKPEVTQKPETPRTKEAKAPKTGEPKRISSGSVITRTQSTWTGERDALPVAPLPMRPISPKWRERPAEARRSEIMADRRPISRRHVEQSAYPEKRFHGRDTMHRSYRDRF